MAAPCCRGCISISRTSMPAASASGSIRSVLDLCLAGATPPSGVAIVMPAAPAHWLQCRHVRCIHRHGLVNVSTANSSLPWRQGHAAMTGNGKAAQGGRAVGPDWTDSLAAFRSNRPAGLTIEYGCEVASLVRPPVDA